MVEFITMAPTSGDGEFVGVTSKEKQTESWTGTDESAERQPTLEYIKAIAQAAEKGGFSTLLLPTGAGCLDSLVAASHLAAHTETLKFLFAVRPGFTAPSVFAKQFTTLDYWSGGRALVNIVTGGSPKELAGDGDFLDHDTRYRRTEEFITVLKRLFTEDTVNHAGEFFKLEDSKLYPKPSKVPDIYFGGASDAGKRVGTALSDVYMLWGETREQTKERIDELKQLAAEKNRKLSYSFSFQVVLGDTEEEAWANADRLLSKSGPGLLEKKRNLTAKGDSVGVKRLAELMENGKENGFRIGPNLWAGLTQVLSGNSIALVGTPGQVADRIVEYVELGFDKVLLRGFPHLETIEQIGARVIPKVKEKLAAKKAVKA